jgi:glyoxylase I family protein
VMLSHLYVDHLVFRVRDMTETQLFYGKLLGEPASRSEGSLMYIVGPTRLFFTASSCRRIEPYDKEQPGLNHLAFGIHRSEDLREVLNRLNEAGLQHSGIKIDHYGNKEFIWLDDPNGFRLEFYCRPAAVAS